MGRDLACADCGDEISCSCPGEDDEMSTDESFAHLAAPLTDEEADGPIFEGPQRSRKRRRRIAAGAISESLPTGGMKQEVRRAYNAWDGAALRAEMRELDAARPKTRGECAPDGGGPHACRPCAWYGCKYHLGMEVTYTGSIIYRPLEALTETCALDVADRGGTTLEDVGDLSAITRERARQIETIGMVLLRGNADAQALADEVLSKPVKRELFQIRRKRED